MKTPFVKPKEEVKQPTPIIKKVEKKVEVKPTPTPVKHAYVSIKKQIYKEKHKKR